MAFSKLSMAMSRPMASSAKASFRSFSSLPSSSFSALPSRSLLASSRPAPSLFRPFSSSSSPSSEPSLKANVQQQVVGCTNAFLASLRAKEKFFLHTEDVATRPDFLTVADLNAFHRSSYSLLALIPASFLLTPSFLSLPLDTLVSLVVSYHSLVGLAGVVEDYVPRKQQGTALFFLVLGTGAALIGLFKLNFYGAGLTETVKNLWRAPKYTPEQLKKIKQEAYEAELTAFVEKRNDA